ncbi:IS66 family insertion sequence element accessory protein TnpB [Candidatus Magnetobacterium casense]|uniref:IS66 family insertion sequence element accessory protein TnpB n=1 Tax=Candidatus Magnetobacterium casense TaxID=1455061 RepID=A0ABS6S3L0_9BACT|nr:IS66 family insertion sequence element accessory protein TnpB [Candidatus Magnetobacterium casensis]MBV6343442.1 IS66 family insertion sequence element accessory protein TnpB [Candidatus Magnetobacterium casensis]
MIQITPQMRILVAVEAVDFRKGIDGLAGLCRQSMREDPFSGSVFVFRNRGKTAIRVLAYDGQGFWLCQKRLSKGRFQWWPGGDNEKISRLAAHQLQLLLWSGNPDGGQVAPLWKEIKTSP